MPNRFSLYYWPIPFRGHFIRYVLAHVGAGWDEPDVDALVALKTAPVAQQPLPFMAPPLLQDRAAGIWLSQMPAILGYIGQVHGLMPRDPARAALVAKIISDANDVLEEITRDCGAKMWTQDAWDGFAADRLPRWLQIFETTGRAHGLRAESGFLLGGAEPGLADLVTAALWHSMAEKLPPLEPLIRRHAPAVANLAWRIAETPAIAEMRARQDAANGNAYCGGEIERSLRAVLNQTGKEHA